MSALQDYEKNYWNQKGFVDNAYTALIKDIDENYAASQKSVDDTSNKALKEAYVSKMKTERELPQTLSALGITGGMSESTAASLQNSYGQNRNKTELARSDSLNKLLLQYNTDKRKADLNKTQQHLSLDQSYAENKQQVELAEAQLKAQQDLLKAQQDMYNSMQFQAQNTQPLYQTVPSENKESDKQAYLKNYLSAAEKQKSKPSGGSIKPHYYSMN